MHLTFLRHGIAGTHDSEELRALTAEGKTQTETLSQSLKRNGEKYDLIVSSSFLRAQQTAEIVAEILGIKDRLLCDPRLTCGCHWNDLQSVLQEHPEAQNILIVGHAPDLGIMVAELLGCSKSVEFQKGSALKVKTPFFRAGSATLLFFIPPSAL
jgi:phosphohistidine phosphatase